MYKINTFSGHSRHIVLLEQRLFQQQRDLNVFSYGGGLLGSMIQNLQGDDLPEGSKPKVPLKKGTLTPRRTVDKLIKRPWYVKNKEKSKVQQRKPEIHDEEGLILMRRACILAANILRDVEPLIVPGITTDQIDEFVHNQTVAAGAYPSPLMYGGFPKSVCTSVNECACHGIPDDTALREGDIINVDVTVYLDGYHGDTSKMFKVGKVSDAANRLVEATERALYDAIAACGPKKDLNVIGSAIQVIEIAQKLSNTVHLIHSVLINKWSNIQQNVAAETGLFIQSDFVGHGVGKEFHTAPMVVHKKYDYPAGYLSTMPLGSTFTIEPIFAIGSKDYRIWADDWTAVTMDGSYSAQCEHTVLITKDGAEILTKPGELPPLPKRKKPIREKREKKTKAKKKGFA